MRSGRAVGLALVLVGIVLYNRNQHAATHSRVAMAAGITLMVAGFVFLIAARFQRTA